MLTASCYTGSMASQLRVVKPQSAAEPPPLAVFRADARLRLWAVAVCDGAAIAPLAARFLFRGAYLLVAYTAHRAVRYTLRGQRLEVEKGLLGRRYESIELWRVRDVVLDQALLERVRGVGLITLYSTDQVEPVLHVGPVASAKALFDLIRDAVAAARKDARVVPLDAGR